MKRILIIIILFFVWINLPSTGYKSLYVFRAQSINPYEKLWKAICQIESSNNPNAFCIDVNGYPSVGIAQIQESRLNDYNNRSGDSLTMDDLFHPDKSRRIFMWYASEIDPNNTEKISRCWNGGCGGMNYESTKEYFKKVKRILYNEL